MNCLEEYRREIDSINKKMVQLFVDRMKVSIEIGKIKKEQGLPIRHPDRENEILESLSEDAEEKFKPYIREFLEKLMEESRKVQEENLDE